MSRHRDFRRDLRSLLRNLGVFEPRIPELALGLSQCHALLELEKGPLSLGTLAQYLGLEISTASRNMRTLERRGFVSSRRDARDPRVKLHRLSASGRERLRAIHRRGDAVVDSAFASLSASERAEVMRGVSILSRALARAEPGIATIRRSQPGDDPAIARLIRSVLEELGQDNDRTAYDEPDTFRIHQFYRAACGEYHVLLHEGRIVGGGGIYPHDRTRCEVKHMYLLPEARGRGHGRRLLAGLIDAANRLAFEEIVLETYSGWRAAVALYEVFGFERCAMPAGYRGHAWCDRMYRLDLALARVVAARCDDGRPRTRSA